ncbi:glycosyltransferase family 1 protein [hot springs metagenome]|uniref:Glycosyltransferase family 1 protein n=1 Tax=hot springs metagenome TaxID=433727 RepID=A0A5J4KZZ2_9ZZZZ
MRLAFIKKRFSIYGGAEKYLQTLIQQLKNSNYEIHVFANQWSEEKGIAFHRVNIIPFTSFLSTLTFDRNSKVKIQKSKFDCVISFERTTCQDIYRAGEGCHAEWLKIRSTAERYYKRLSFKINPLHIYMLKLEKEIFTNTKLIVANSEMVKKQIIDYYAVPKENITVIYNGVDLKRFSPQNKEKWRKDVRDSLNISEDTTVLLFVGSGFKRKGLKTFINAIASINGHNLKALIIGKGNTDKYKAIAKKLGVLHHIMFLGIQKEIERFYASADLFVLPTLYDPFSNATLEAMASGIPVITTKNNGAAELIYNGCEGFVMHDMFDAHELAEKINTSLKNLNAMGGKAREKAEAFPIEVAAEKFVKAIETTQL